MDTARTTTNQARRRALLIGGAGAVAAAAAATLVLTTGASAAPAAAPSPAAARSAVGIEAIWSQTPPAARHAVCASHLADPAGAWQVLAPVLTAHGADLASTRDLLGRACADEVSIADARG